MENINLISLDTVLQTWAQIASNELHYNEDLLFDIMMDAIDDIGAYKQYKEKVQVIKLSDFKAKLPCGFKQSLYVLVREKKEDLCKPLELIEYIKPEHGNSNCEWVYKKQCKCKEKCNGCCSENYIETAGWWFIDNMARLDNLKFGSVYDFTNWKEISKSEWSVLMPKANEISLTNRFNIDFKTNSKTEYLIDNGYLYSDIKDGEILISYLSLPLDDNNLPLVPNVGNYVQALIAAIEKRLAYIQYRKSRENKDLQFFQVTEKEYIKYKLKAQEDLNNQTFSEMWAMGKNLNGFFISEDLKNNSRGRIKNRFTKY